MGNIYTLHFPNTKAKEEKGPFNWGSWVNPPPESKYLITKGYLTLPKGQTLCDSSIKTDPWAPTLFIYMCYF